MSCLFKGNGFDSTFGLDCGGAIALTQYIAGGKEEVLRASGPSSATIVSAATIRGSTFIANHAPCYGAAIYASGGVGCDLTRCLFVDLAGSRPDFLTIWETPTGSCNIAWPHPSPFHEGTWGEKTAAVIGTIADPRLPDRKAVVAIRPGGVQSWSVDPTACRGRRSPRMRTPARLRRHGAGPQGRLKYPYR